MMVICQYFYWLSFFFSNKLWCSRNLEPLELCKRLYSLGYPSCYIHEGFYYAVCSSHLNQPRVEMWSTQHGLDWVFLSLYSWLVQHAF